MAAAAAYRVTFDEWLNRIPNVDAQGARFNVWIGDTVRVLTVQIAGPTLLALPVLAGRTTPKQMELGIAGDEFMNDLHSALLRFAVMRIEQTLRDARPGADDLPQVIEVGEADASLIASMMDEKNCRYQFEQESDLYCSAAAPNDETVSGSVGLRRLAPTSRPLCAACGMPDAEFVCSHLAHAEVFGILASGGLIQRVFAGALCELNRPEIERPGSCRAGGHDCWERVVSSEDRSFDTNLPPTALAEAFDHLDVVWRLAFGKSKGLLGLRTATDTVGLALPATSREELEARASDLAEVLDGLRVGDELLPSDLEDDLRKGTINRLEACLKEQLPADSVAALGEPIKTLRALVGVRAAFQHANAAQRLPVVLHALGISYPLRDHGLAWGVMRARAVEALNTIRDTLRRSTLE